MTKVIAVTGSTGFVGRYVSCYLENQGYKIVRLGRKDVPGSINWDIEQGILPYYLKVDGVVHCAALVDDWAQYKESFSVNVLGTRNVLSSFSKAPLFIYIGSSSIYSSACKKKIITEQDCIGGTLFNSYSKTKLLAEQEVIKSPILSRIILRPHIIYGPGDTTILPRIKKAMKFGYLFLPGNGENEISFTHIKNLAQAILLSIETHCPGVHIYNIVDARPTSIKQAVQSIGQRNNMKLKSIFIPLPIAWTFAFLIEIIYRLFKIAYAPLLTRYRVVQLSGNHVLDIRKARYEIGYTPIHDITSDY